MIALWRKAIFPVSHKDNENYSVVLLLLMGHMTVQKQRVTAPGLFLKLLPRISTTKLITSFFCLLHIPQTKLRSSVGM